MSAKADGGARPFASRLARHARGLVRGGVHHGAFLRHAMAEPALVGALAPSSRWLADAMARAADGAAGLIELGGGSGAITAALIERHPSLPLCIVELQPQLAERLRNRFPFCQIECASADEALTRMDRGQTNVTVVSSLPFRSLPPPIRARCVDAVMRFLLAAPGRRLVQYTYQPRVPFALHASDEFRVAATLQWSRIDRVWRNAPPAGVWVLQRAD